MYKSCHKSLVQNLEVYFFLSSYMLTEVFIIIILMLQIKDSEALHNICTVQYKNLKNFSVVCRRCYTSSAG